MNKGRISVLFVLMGTLLLMLPAVVNANHAWSTYHWERSSNPIRLEIGDNVDSRWDAYLDEAIVDWNASSVLTVVEVPGTTRTRRCNADTGEIEVCNDAYGYTGWLGIAGISISGGHITSGYTKVNDSYFDSPTYDTPAWRRLVMCQEIGHDFGLGHQDEAFGNLNKGSCMDYTDDPDGDLNHERDPNDERYGEPSNEHPNAHDYQQLEDIYAHLDPADTGGGGGGGGSCKGGPKKCPDNFNGLNIVDFSNANEWGQLVRSNGRISVYERDFGHGNKVITFVTWALETDR